MGVGAVESVHNGIIDQKNTEHQQCRDRSIAADHDQNTTDISDTAESLMKAAHTTRGLRTNVAISGGSVYLFCVDSCGEIEIFPELVGCGDQLKVLFEVASSLPQRHSQHTHNSNHCQPQIKGSVECRRSTRIMSLVVVSVGELSTVEAAVEEIPIEDRHVRRPHNGVRQKTRQAIVMEEKRVRGRRCE
jgi:hypothetical protein